MGKHRPKNLNLLTIRFPIPAIVSILHRISGVVLFLAIPFTLWALGYSLASQSQFQVVHDLLSQPFFKVISWCVLAPFLYHFAAGIRHLLMDVNIGVELKSGRLTAAITLAVSIVLVVLVGVYLW